MNEKEIARESEVKVYGFFRGIVKIGWYLFLGYIGLHIIGFILLFIALEVIVHLH